MKLERRNQTLLVALLASTGSHAFAPSATRPFVPVRTVQTTTYRPAPSLFSSTREGEDAVETETDDEIERLRSMAAKLRAEASALEAEQAAAMAAAAEKAFRKFDANQDGEISVQELKDGLEKTFKMELSTKRVQQLMADFDKTGDGTLRVDEFVGVDKFRNRLDQLAREEKQMARQKAAEAEKEKMQSELLEQAMTLINDKPPSQTDKILSVLPYLFPLLDGLQFGRYFILENVDNPISVGLALLYALYRAIPFGGFIAFFALITLAGNTRINRLVRFNMQQAIYLDIALFFPGLIASLYNLVGRAGGFQIPAQVTEIGTDAIFFTLLAAVGYSMVSSLLGQTPNKIPLISDAVERRLGETMVFDGEKFIKPTFEKDKDKDKKQDDETKDS